MPVWPAVTLDLPASRGWQFAVTTLAVLALASLCGWAWQTGNALPDGFRLGGLAAGAAAVASSLTLRRARPSTLRWDGCTWWLQPAAGAPLAGQLSVAVDLGAWMLLRFDAGAPTRRQWLPVGRAGLAGQWHALRCTVYSARPAPGSSSAAASTASTHERR